MTISNRVSEYVISITTRYDHNMPLTGNMDLIEPPAEDELRQKHTVFRQVAHICNWSLYKMLNEEYVAFF